MAGHLDDVAKDHLKVEKPLPTIDKLESAWRLIDVRPAANEKQDVKSGSA
jgi:hypothetical protein